MTITKTEKPKYTISDGGGICCNGRLLNSCQVVERLKTLSEDVNKLTELLDLEISKDA